MFLGLSRVWHSNVREVKGDVGCNISGNDVREESLPVSVALSLLHMRNKDKTKARSCFLSQREKTKRRPCLREPLKWVCLVVTL